MALQIPHLQAGQAWRSGPKAHYVASCRLPHYWSAGWSGAAYDAGAHDHAHREGRVRQIPASRAKEYRENLCRCFALAIWRHLSKHAAVEGSEEVEPVASELAALSSRVDPAGQMQPDYQPMRWESFAWLAARCLKESSKKCIYIYVYIYICIYLSVYLSIYLSIYIYIYIFFYLFTCAVYIIKI